MKQRMNRAVSRPFPWLGMGVSRAFSIFSGAVRVASTSAKGLEKKATTRLGGTQLPRSSSSFASSSDERITFDAARKSP